MDMQRKNLTDSSCKIEQITKKAASKVLNKYSDNF